MRRTTHPVLHGAGSLALLLVLPALLAIAPPLAAQMTIDDLATLQGPVSSTGAPAFAATATGGALGGERDLEVTRTSGSGTVTAAVVAGNRLSFTTAAGDTGRAVLAWDGSDGAATLNQTGLGGTDLTVGGLDALRLSINQASPGLQLRLELWSDATHSSALTLTLPELAPATDLILPFSDLLPSQGSLGADPADIGAITLAVESLDGSGGSIELQGPFLTTTAAPVISALKDDLRFPGGTPLITATVGPGGTMTYRITISNTGAEATDVQLDDLLDSIDNISSGTPLNLRSTPIAADDRYDHCGNSTLMADGSGPGLDGLLANDHDPDGDPLTVVAVQSPTDQGGTVVLDDAATGAFTYQPPAGHRGSDTFTYTAEDDDGNQVTATAVISIPRLVWFVDSSHAGSDQGTQANPFHDLSQLNGAAANLDGPGDIIFVYEGAGAYTGGLLLEPDQQLLGAPAGLSECVATPIPPSGNRPVITSGGVGVGISLATNNTIDSVIINGTTGTGLQGTAFTAVTISSTDVTAAGGAAVDLDGGTVAASFGALSSTGTAGAPGLELSNLDGSFTVTGSTQLTNPTGAGIRVTNAATGSSFAFGATTVSDTSIGGGASGDGIDLTIGNDAFFSFDTLAVTADGGAGLRASSSGTINLNSTTATISATGGPAVDLTSTAGQTNGLSGWTFSSLSATASGGAGLRLVSLGDSFTATTCTVNGAAGHGLELVSNLGPITVNGGSISAASNNAVDSNGGSGDVTILAAISNTSNRSVNIVSRSGGTITIAGSINDTGTGINLASNSGGATIFSGSSKVISTGASPAVTLAGNAGHSISFTGGGLDIDTTSGVGLRAFGGAAGIAVSGAGNSITSTTGTALSVSSTTIAAAGLSFASISANGAVNGIVLNSTGGLGGLTVTGDGTFDQNGSGGTIQGATGDAIVLTSTRDVSLSELDITGPAGHGIIATDLQGSNLYRAGVISGVAGASNDAIRVTNTSTNLTLLSVDNSLITGVNAGGNDGILFDMKGSSVARLDVVNSCHLNGLQGDGVQVLADDDSTVTVNILSSRFSNDAGYQTGRSRLSLRAADGSLPQTGGGNLTATITGNTISDTGIQSDDTGIPVGTVGVVDVLSDQFASVDLTITNNVISNLDIDAALRVVADDSTQSMRALIQGNAINNVREGGVLLHIRDQTVLANLWLINNDLGTGPNGIPGDGDDQPVGTDNAFFHEDTIRLLVQENVGTVNVKMTGNEMVNGSSSQCVDADSEDAAVLNLTMHNNTLVNAGTGGEAFDIEADNGGAVCLDLNGNNVAGERNTLTSANSSVVDREPDGGTYTIEDLSGGTNETAVTSFLTARNTFSPGLLVDPATFATTAECPEPS